MRRTRWGLGGLIGAAVLSCPLMVQAASNVLAWTDNSTNEANFHIERTTAADLAACQTAVGFAQIATTGVNVVTFTDAAVSEGTTYCYRVKASNPGGSSGYTNVAGRSVPFSIPVSPSALGVTGGP